MLRGFIEPQVVPSEEGTRPGEDLTVEGDIARPPLSQQRETTEVTDSSRAEASAPAQAAQAAAAEQGIDPQQLPAEVIDRIARRAVELMSERVVQEIAWEVVPALSERLITQRLDELARKE